MSETLERLTTALAGRYSIERELGRGGMAVVYLARDEKHDRHVALKVMLPEAVGEDGVARFRREIQIAARLSHPHILTVFDSGDVGDLAYYVMPYVEGESLRDAIVRERHLGILEAASIIRQVADALDYAHAEGVIHRDIKPANIMLQRARTRAGGGGLRTPIVADFGIARAMTGDSSSRLTATGLMVGTPTYMSPEQWGGDSHLDGRSDQYSLACVLYEMLIGEPPFNGATPMIVLARHTREPVPSLRAVRPTVPEGLEQVIYRAMAKVPADRFATMGEFGDALAAATEGPIVYSSTDNPVINASSAGIQDYASSARFNPTGSASGFRIPPSNAPPQSVSAGTVDASAPTSQLAIGGVRRKRRVLLFGAAAAMGLVAAVAITWKTTQPDTPARTKLMVFPFDNIGPVGDSTFADGLTAEIISRLSGVPRLGVVARTSAMQYKGTTKTLKQIGTELGVSKIVQGSVKWNPGATDARQATISVSIVNTEDEIQTPVNDFDAANLDDLYNIASAVAAKLELTVDTKERARLAERPTEIRDAYEAYQKGNYFFYLSWDTSNVKAAIANFETATKLDPKYAVAWAALGRAHGWMYQLNYDHTEPRLVYAKQAIDSALSLSPDLPEAQLALGLYYYWGKRDYERALEQFKGVQRALPSSAETYNYMANIQRRRGALRDAVQNYALASDLSPRDHLPMFNSAEALLYLRDYAQAQVLVERVIELAPAFIDGPILKATLQIHLGDVARARQTLADLGEKAPPNRWRSLSHHWRAGLFRIVDDSVASSERRMVAGSFGLDSAEYFLARGEMYQRFAQRARARAYFDSALNYNLATLRRRPDQPIVYGELSLSYAGLQQRDEAARAAEHAVQLLDEKRDALDGPEWLINVAAVHSLMGDPAKAIPWLDRAMRVPSRLSPTWLKLDPIWNPIRNDARFQKLITEPPPLAQTPAR